jgi:hypothetical protein
MKKTTFPSGLSSTGQQTPAAVQVDSTQNGKHDKRSLLVVTLRRRKGQLPIITVQERPNQGFGSS